MDANARIALVLGSTQMQCEHLKDQLAAAQAEIKKLRAELAAKEPADGVPV